MTRSSSTARSTAPTPKRRVARVALSETAWERVLDRLRMKLPDKPSRTAVFGRAGLRFTKMTWMRRQPDLRSSVVVKLSRALNVTPEKFFEMMVDESRTDRLGEIHF